MGASMRLRALVRRPSAWATAAVVLPLAVVAVRLFLDGSYAPYGDNAVIELTVRDVGRHAVLLGPYSRFGWFHPGPSLFYVLAIPYRLMGSHSTGMNLGALLVNAAALVGIAWIAFRRGGRALLFATLVVFAVFLQQLGPDYWRSPWNPNITVVPFALFLFVAWELSRGEPWALPAASAIGTFVAQSHVGYLIAIAAIGAGATAIGAVTVARARRVAPDLWADRRRALLRAGAFALGVIALLWSLPIAQQLTHHPGNLGRMVRFERHVHPDHSLHEGVDLVLRQMGTIPAWLTGASFRADGTFAGSGGWPAAVSVGAFLGATAISWRRRAWSALRLGALVAILLVASAISVSRIVGGVTEYLVRWMAVGGLGIWAFVAAAIWTPGGVPAPTRVGRSQRVATAALGIALAVIVTIDTVDGVRERGPDTTTSKAVTALTSSIRSHLPRGGRAVLLRSIAALAWPSAFGVAVQLERHGIDVRFDRSVRDVVGDRRTSAARTHATTITFGTADQRAILRSDPALRQAASAGGVVAFVGPPS